MKALVVVESVFGNTRRIAEAVARGLGAQLDVALVDVTHAPETVEDVDLLVVGGPTHVFGMTRPNTRQGATDQSGGAVAAGTVGLREWLLTAHVGAVACAAFDTRMGKRWIPGSAAAGAGRSLRKRGLTMLVRPETFWVVGTQGPLRDGELDRAAAWGAALAARLSAAQPA
jgi:hypothetical protein